jgi:hypothetical protein
MSDREASDVVIDDSGDAGEFSPKTSRMVTAHDALATQSPDRISRARANVERFTREQLVYQFGNHFVRRRRAGAWIIADEMVRRGIPPVFWFSDHNDQTYLRDQELDLVTYDLHWLRWWHPAHHQDVRYTRYKQMLLGADAVFFDQAQFLFWRGNRTSSEMVRLLSLTEQQQFDFIRIRSRQVAGHRRRVEEQRQKVFSALRSQARGCALRPTGTGLDPNPIAVRRLRLWTAAQFTDASPTATAKRYEQMTGECISRQCASKQLGKIKDVLDAKGLKFFVRRT